MKKLLIPVFCALALLACNGGQKQNNGGQTAEVGDSAEIVSDNSETESGSQTNIAEEVFKKYYPYDKGGCTECDGLSYGGRNEYDCEECYGGADVYCYPKNDGGYLVVGSSYYTGGYDCKPEFYFSTRVYKDGVLDTVEAYALPTPKLEMLLHPDRVDDNLPNIAAFKVLYDKNPDKYLFFDLVPPKSLTVKLNAWDCENAICNMDRCWMESDRGDQLLEYTWDGTKFVVNPQTVPSTNLESISSVGDNSSCDMQEIWRQFAEGQYDAVEPTIEGNTAEYFDQSSDEGYTIRIKLVSFAWEGSCKVFCVTDHTEGDESTNTLTEYNFIGGELSETELQPTLKEYADKSEASIENGEIVFASQDVAFLWNGSMMIKE